MKITKLISTLLAVLMLAGAFAILVNAEETGTEGPVFSTNTGNGHSLMKPNTDPQTKDDEPYLYKTGEYEVDGKTMKISTPEEKIALMDYRYGTDKFELYVDAYSGEVAIRSKATGETLFTNPYNIGQSTATSSQNSTKDELLSQLIIHYTEHKSDTGATPLYSYTWAALRNQITVMNIKGGVRVEYTIGREESKSLLPHMIEASAMEEIFNTIQANMEAAIAAGTVPADKAADERHRLEQFKAFYSRYSLDDAINQEMHDKYCEDYPILEKFEQLAQTDPSYKGFAIYVIDKENMGEQTIKKQEALIKEYCKEYTFEDLEEDHAYVEYDAEIETYPLFKLALEYTIEDSGLVVRLPANGIRFNEALYRLDYIEILPYMGAGMNPHEGYTFFPDGSGTLFDFQEIANLTTRQVYTGKVYGQDFAYHEPSGMYEEIIRYPVYGIYEKEIANSVEDPDGTSRGFVAIVEEGDSLIELSTSHGGMTSEYNTMKLSVYPRPTDSYNIADAISVGSNTEWTVVSARKYTGSYKVRYIMLTDADAAEKANADAIAAGLPAETYYETSYVGMAKAYRDYLEKDLKVISRLTKEDVSEDIPLYIESFGALMTTEKFLSIPIDVMTPLTTFEDIRTMYDDLKDVDIKNVNFILKGFTKGGMTSPRVPYNLKWENAVSKEINFEEITEYAKQENFGLFPDFDFVFSSTDTLFDGLSLGKHAAKTIDNRYTSKREYSATKHTYVSYFELALSPAYFSHFYKKFLPKYEKYSPVGISVSTLGSYLNSDFDEDEPYNRADGQKYTEEAFAYIRNELADSGTEIMTSGGNAYTWKYVDHITDIALDSSRLSLSSASVPFLGIVLHGYIEIAGTPINMEGNFDYALLKSIENGAALKFILSYRNTNKLKEYVTLSQYYSVDYSIWYKNGTGDLVTMYKRLNEVINDIQTSIIIGHEFVDGMRVPDDDELMLDAEQAIKDAIAYEKALENANSESERKAIYEARQFIINSSDILKNAIDSTAAEGLAALIKNYEGAESEALSAALDKATKTLEAYRAVQQFHAIYSDVSKNSFGDGYNTVYTVENAIKAYDAYKAAETDATKKDAWERYAAILGADYSAKLVAMLDAKKAADADADNAELKAKYDEALKALNDTTAGAVVDVDKAIAAMNDATLKTLMDAYIAAYNGTDEAAKTAAKTAFEAKIDELYGEMIKGFVYSITYGGKAVGGSQFNRDSQKAAYTEATKSLDAAYADFYAAAADIKDSQVLLNKVYTIDAIKAAIDLIEANNAYSDVERARLKAIYTEIAEYMTANKSKYDELLNFKVDSAIESALVKYNALYDATDAAGVQVDVGNIKDYEISGMKASAYLTKPEFTWTETDHNKESSNVVVEKPVPNTKKYESDDNKIVHETFDNGKEFLLNFNDYRVVVELNGTVYTIDAYGFVIIHGVNA